MTDLCAVVLAAGEGTRLRPLTGLLPKALCPVGNVPLLDLALARLAELGFTGPDRVAVNAAWLGEQVVAHVAGRTHVSVEPDGPYGTGGGLSRLREWIGGRDVLVGNADAYLSGGSLAPLLADWQGTGVRLLGVPGRPGQVDAFAGHQFAGFSLLSWAWVRDLPERKHELVGSAWRPAEAAGELTVVRFDGYYRDTGTPADYLAANLHAAETHGTGGNLIHPDATVTGPCERAVVGADAQVAGAVTRAVVWPGARVAADEHLRDTVRTP